MVAELIHEDDRKRALERVTAIAQLLNNMKSDLDGEAKTAKP